MLKNYKDNDKKIAKKLRSIILNKYKHVDDETEQINNQTDNRADFLGLRIIDNLIRFNQIFRLSQVAIKANMPYEWLEHGNINFDDNEDDNEDDNDMKGGMNTRSNKLEEDSKQNLDQLLKGKTNKLIELEKKKNKLIEIEKESAETQKIVEEMKKAIKDKDVNKLDGDSKFSQSFESLLSAYSLMENIRKNYRDLRPIFSELSVPIFNDLKDILDDSNDIIRKSSKKLNDNTSKNIMYYNDRLDQIIKIFDSIYDDFQQRKQTFNTNISGSGFSYLNKIRNI